MMDMEADWNVWSSADQQYAPMSSHADSVAFVDSNTATPFAGLSYPFASEDSYSAAVSISFLSFKKTRLKDLFHSQQPISKAHRNFMDRCILGHFFMSTPQ